MASAFALSGLPSLLPSVHTAARSPAGARQTRPAPAATRRRTAIWAASLAHPSFRAEPEPPRAARAHSKKAAFAGAAAAASASAAANSTAAAPALASVDAPAPDAWREALVVGAVVEAWCSGKLCFGVLTDRYERGVMLAIVDVAEGSERSTTRDSVKVSFGEVVAVWPRHLSPCRSAPPSALAADIDAGIQLIKSSRPRSLNLSKVYDMMRKLPKADHRSKRTSFQLAPKMFPLFMKGPRERRAAATVATAMLISTDRFRFKRGDEGIGWRALPPSVTIARGRCSFVDVCKKLLDASTPARDRASPWSRQHLDILREIEVAAASGSAAADTAATSLQALGYKPTDDGAASLLLDIGYWGSGTVERDGGGCTQQAAAAAAAAAATSMATSRSQRGSTAAAAAAAAAGAAVAGRDGTTNNTATTSSGAAARPMVVSRQPLDRAQASAAGAIEGTGSPFSLAIREDWSASSPSGVDVEEIGSDGGADGERKRANQAVRDWTFPPPILAEARDLRQSARDRRIRYVNGDSFVPQPRRNLIHGVDGHPPPRVYCVDDKNARFLDDAFSIEVLEPGKLVRVCVHVADVDETVRSGSAIDELAKERGQSLYLPLKPLHMLPAAAMDAASFSTAFPTEGITAVMDVDVSTGEMYFWEVFASLVPPVVRVNYDQFDAALAAPEKEATCDLSPEVMRDLKKIADVSSILAEKLDTRRNARRQRRGGIRIDAGDASGDTRDDGDGSSASLASPQDADDLALRAKVGVASVRLVRKRDVTGSRRTKVAQVVDFRSTGGHAVVADMLVSVSTLFRQFAHRHGAFLPENRGAFMYVSRCGTAPMRRYADLAIQRQIKCILFGRQPAGRRRMDELRAWLAKRHLAGERTVATRRQAALYNSLADHCASQQSVSNLPYAVLTGRVRTMCVTRKRAVRAEVGIEGTGLHVAADVEDSVVPTGDWGSIVGTQELRAHEVQLELAHKSLKNGDRVELRVSHVDPVAQRIVARVVAVVGR
jgi:RNB domain